MTKGQVLKLVGDLKSSETVKVNCGHRLIAFYDSLGGADPIVTIPSDRTNGGR